MCDSSLGISTDPNTLTISMSPSSLLIRQSGAFYTATDFQSLLQNVFFEAGASSPQQSYQALVMVTVSDGELVNQRPAFTTVQVNVMNEPPRVLLDGEVYSVRRVLTQPKVQIHLLSLPQSLSAEVVMADGVTSVPLSNSHTIRDDSSLITKLTITLSNPQDHTSIENISLSSTVSLPQEIFLQSSGQILELSGLASVEVYSSALSGVVYSNAKMASIIQNQPNFTPRQVAEIRVEVMQHNLCVQYAELLA